MTMKEENLALPSNAEPGGRITRARAAACHASGALLSLKPLPSKPEKKHIQREKRKKDENNFAAPSAAFQPKKRAVLRDVTNMCCESSFKNCINAANVQAKITQRAKSGPSKAKLCHDKKSVNFAPVVSVVSNKSVIEDPKAEHIQEMKIFGSQETAMSSHVKDNVHASQNVESLMDGESTCTTALFEDQDTSGGLELVCQTKRASCKLPGGHSPEFIDIDCDHANPQMCCLYSSVIYTNLRAAELLRRPSSNFMETVQRDITHSMRGILIDWLIEVSDEYRLVPDTLYLGVYMIDRFLSQNYIERQRLQLVGITCMLIASKYEEICAPRAEEFCFITDNTYTKGEVLKMEIQVLNFLSFQLSVPTIKTFLRRFIRAAHASYKVPPKVLSHLANYLAELTLVEYSFLKFLPSAIAASAVFLARWTLDQSAHPWNATLEYYTSYKASDLETTVLAMHDLQKNFSNCPLNAIRDKYKHQKFESVATMTSPKLIQSLFC